MVLLWRRGPFKLSMFDMSKTYVGTLGQRRDTIGRINALLSKYCGIACAIVITAPPIAGSFLLLGHDYICT